MKNIGKSNEKHRIKIRFLLNLPYHGNDEEQL